MSEDIKPSGPAKASPANAPQKSAERSRVPMSLPHLKLAVPEIPGYHLHWMNGTPSRIAQAMKAGYEFVDPEEVDIINTGLADPVSKSGNTDLGSRVSIVAGADIGADGAEQRLYLMKIKQEWFDEDQRGLEERNEETARSLRGGNPDSDTNPYGKEQRYIPEGNRRGVENLFTPKRRP